MSDPLTHLGVCLERKTCMSMYMRVYACVCVYACTGAHRVMQKLQGFRKKRENRGTGKLSVAC